MINIDQFTKDIENRIGGWCSPEKQKFLMETVLRLKAKLVYEIGVWEGKSAIPMATAMKMQGFGTLVPIDSWCFEDATANGEASEAPFARPEKYQDFLGRVEEFGLWDHILKCDPISSYEASLVYTEKADLIHIDGNHSAWSSVSDLMYWYPKLKEGGVMVLDDVGRTTTRMVEELADSKMKVLAKDGVWKAYEK